MLSEENHFVLDQKVGLEKEVKLQDADGNVRNKIKLGVPYPKVPVTEEGDHLRGPLFLFIHHKQHSLP
jgi:hypothetical protein